MKTERPMEIVPALRQVELVNVGCWRRCRLDFAPGLNVIAGDSGTGKSTIFQAILRALHPTLQMEEPLASTRGCTAGRISVQLIAPIIGLDFRRYEGGHVDPLPLEAAGDYSFRLLREGLKAGLPGAAFLIEAEVLNILDRVNYVEALKVLNSTRDQVICQVPHCRYERSDFPKARIFRCSFGNKGEPVTVLEQAGGGVVEA